LCRCRAACRGVPAGGGPRPVPSESASASRRTRCWPTVVSRFAASQAGSAPGPARAAEGDGAATPVSPNIACQCGGRCGMSMRRPHCRRAQAAGRRARTGMPMGAGAAPRHWQSDHWRRSEPRLTSLSSLRPSHNGRRPRTFRAVGRSCTGRWTAYALSLPGRASST
jgi:hypothetical protein